MSEGGSMHIEGDSYEHFREGLADGYAAGRSQELMYAIGFAAGFLWGALFDRRKSESGYRRAVHVA
jgi:hypothetical protein